MHAFLMVLDATGAVQSLNFECPGESWRRHMEALDTAGLSYLFHDPFDAPEYTWLSWSRIDCQTMERLIGSQFEDADFVKDRYRSSRAPALEPPGRFPVSWGVMF